MPLLKYVCMYTDLSFFIINCCFSSGQSGTVEMPSSVQMLKWSAGPEQRGVFCYLMVQERKSLWSQGAACNALSRYAKPYPL